MSFLPNRANAKIFRSFGAVIRKAGGGVPVAPAVVIAPSIIAQPLVGQAVEMDEGLVTGATSTTYQWYSGAPTATPISGATSVGLTPADTEYGVTLYRRTTYTNAAGSTVVDVAAPAVTGKTYSDDWAGYTVGNTWTQLDTLYNRNSTQIDLDVISDASGPAGKSISVDAATSNFRAVWLAGASTFGIAQAASTSRTQGLYLFKHIGTNSGRYLIRFINDALTGAGPGLLVFNGTAWLQINTDSENAAVGTNMGALTVNSYYWVRIEQAADTIKAKLWDFGDAEPASFTSRACSVSIDPPAPAFGCRFASAFPAAQFDLLYWSGGYNADAPYWAGFVPPIAVSTDPMTYAASSSGTSITQNNSTLVYTVGDI